MPPMSQPTGTPTFRRTSSCADSRWRPSAARPADSDPALPTAVERHRSTRRGVRDLSFVVHPRGAPLGLPLRRTAFVSSSRTATGRPGTLHASRLRVPVGDPSRTVPVPIAGSTRRGFPVAVVRFPTVRTRRSEALTAAGSVLRIGRVVPGSAARSSRSGRGVAAGWSRSVDGVQAPRLPSAQRRLICRFRETRSWNSLAVAGRAVLLDASPLVFVRRDLFQAFVLTPVRASRFRGSGTSGRLLCRHFRPGTRPGPGCGEARGRALSWSAHVGGPRTA